jgi:hypothetical protein
MSDRRCAAAAMPHAKLVAAAAPLAAGTALLFMEGFPFGETETMTKSSSPSESSERRLGATFLCCDLVGELNQVVGLGKAERCRLILLLLASRPAPPLGAPNMAVEEAAELADLVVVPERLIELFSDDVLLLPIGSGSLLVRDHEEEDVDWDDPDMTRRCLF